MTASAALAASRVPSSIAMPTSAAASAPGIVVVFAGVAAGLAAATAVWWRWSKLADQGRIVLLAYAAFGLTLVLLAALSYVNVPGADAFLGLPVNLVIAAVVAVAASIGRWQTRRPSPTL